MYEKKEGDVVMFVNNKEGVETRPDMKGTVFLNGQDYEIAIWQKRDKNQVPYFTGMCKPKKQPQE